MNLAAWALGRGVALTWALQSSLAFAQPAVKSEAAATAESAAAGSSVDNGGAATVGTAAGVVPPASVNPAPSLQAESATELFWRGNDAFSGGRFAEAAELYARAHALSHEPALLFNVAESQRRLGACAAARSAYEQYRAEESSPPRAALDWPAQLDASCGVASPPVSGVVVAPLQPAPGVPSKPPPRAALATPALETAPSGQQSAARPPASDLEKGGSEVNAWTPRHVVAWSLLGAGAVGVAATVWAGLEANQTQRRAAVEAQGLIGSNRPWDAAGATLENRAESQRALAVGFGVTSAALLLTGAYLRWTADDAAHEHASTEPSFKALASTTSAELQWGGAF